MPLPVLPLHAPGRIPVWRPRADEAPIRRHEWYRRVWYEFGRRVDDRDWPGELPERERDNERRSNRY